MIILLGYTLPLTIGMMYWDYYGNATLLHYLLIFILHGYLCRQGIKSGNSKTVFLGNLLGMVTNYALWLIPHPEKWRAYFKCSPSSKFLLAILVFSFAVQLWFLFCDYDRNHCNNT